MPDNSEFQKAYDPHERENAIYKLWEEGGFFAPEKRTVQKTKNPNEGKPFSMTMAPPNVTGSLHMGHALEYTLSDVLIRARRMQGYDTLWLPGSDHAGIATQNVVEKDLRKQGISRYDLGREKFIEKIWEWKNLYGNTIINQLKRLGTSCDWSRQRFTMDAGYVRAVEEAFRHYYEKGWIYRGLRVVSWCTRCQTSLSDLELEYKEEKGKLWYIKYPLSPDTKASTKQDYIMVATTRPETMLGDEAIAVNPKDARFADLQGKMVILPIKGKEIPVVADEAVESSFGTGAVKVTPAHDIADFEISLRHKLPLTQVINSVGRMTEEAGTEYAGLKVLEAREKVLQKLKDLGLLDHEEDYMHRVAVCYRCDTVIEPIPSTQWFVKMRQLADIAMKAVKDGRVKFQPNRWERLYFDWLENVRDWCVSRQIWWGHRIPVWFCANDDKKEKFMVSVAKPATCEFCGSCAMEQASDVLDTWFSSALWPFATLGWPEKTSDLGKYYPTSVLMNDRGIINLWDARMIYSGMEFMGEAPFKDLIIHATVLTKDGKRMSKSLGTGIDPMGLIEKYGADATRFGLVWMSLGGQDMKFGEEPMIAGKKFLNKLWNASRFVTSKLGTEIVLDMPDKFEIPENAAIADGLRKTSAEVSAYIDSYDFGQALHAAHDFFWHEFCDKYIEWSKSRTDTETKQVLGATMIALVRLFHPFAPFATEAIWQNLKRDGWPSQIIIAPWPFTE
jgi:valyl-tRNA synthetase